MWKYKFTCANKEDFLYCAKNANVNIEYYSEVIDSWFKGTDPLIGEDNVWVVDERGHIACFSYEYAKNNLHGVKEIIRNEINLGGL